MSFNDEIIIKNESTFEDSGNSDITKNDDADDNWQPIIEKALKFYSNAPVSAILDNCFQNLFFERMASKAATSPMKIAPNREDAQDTGTMLHQYIERFYFKFHNREDFIIPSGERYVRDMLAALKSEPLAPIAWDKLAGIFMGLDSSAIHSVLHEELIQFYTFVKENYMVREKIEQSITDENHNVSGRYNASFKVNDSDTDLMLYDWTLSKLMVPGSLEVQRKTLQLNIYKYILEKYYGKNIVKMHSVVFHRDNANYSVIEIDDIGFRCRCEKCLKKN